MPIDKSAEKTVNTTKAGAQTAPVITTLSDGSYVVVWVSDGQDGAGTGIYQQHFTAAGVPVGAETRVNVNTNDNQANPSVAALKDGGWAVAWTDNKADNGTPGIYLQRFDKDGKALVATDTKVNTTEASSQKNAVIAAQTDGSFVVTWMSEGQDGSSWGIYQQRYDKDGKTTGSETIVNQQSSNTQWDPVVTRLTDGTVITAWVSGNQDSDNFGIYQRAYKPNGDSITSESVVNTATKGAQTDAAITATKDGWVVTWVSDAQDGSGLGIYQQAWKMVGSTMTKIGVETLVNTTTEGQQFEPSVTGLPDGSWVVTWSGTDKSDGTISIFQQRFLSDGTRHGEEIQVAEFPAGTQISSSCTALQNGDWVVVWTGDDGESTGIKSRTFHIVNEAPVQGTPIIDYLVLAASAGSGTTSTIALPNESFVDPNGEILTWTLKKADGTDLPTWLTFDEKTRTITSKAGQPETGTVIELKATATDKAGLAVSDTFTLKVLQSNAAPVAGSTISKQTALEEQAFSFKIPDGAFTDSDGHKLHYSATLDGGLPLPAWLKFDAASGTFSGTPADADTGNLSIRVSATDTLGKTSQLFSLTINQVNDAPTGKDGTITILEGAKMYFAADSFGFSDTDKNTFQSVELTSLPEHGTMLLNGKKIAAGVIIPVADLSKLIWTPPKDAFGESYDKIGFRVIDNGTTTDGGINKDPTTRTLTLAITDLPDTRSGNNKANKLVGDDGVDILDGRGGADRLTGKGGADVFVFADGYKRDVIVDFDAKSDHHDRIDLSELEDFAVFDDLSGQMTQVGSHVHINAGDGDILIIRKVLLSDLDANDFIF